MDDRFRILLISADARRRADVREVFAASAVAAMVEEADPEKGVSRLASGCFDCGLLDVTGNDDEGLSVLPAVRAAGVPTPVVVRGTGPRRGKNCWRRGRAIGFPARRHRPRCLPTPAAVPSDTRRGCGGRRRRRGRRCGPSARTGPVTSIALSGFGMDEDVRKSKEAGFFEHLTKPVNFQKLQSVIREATEAQAATRR